MFTLFDLLKVISMLFLGGSVAGMGASHGAIWAIIGGIAGAAVGWIIGNLPEIIIMTLLLKKDRKAATEELRKRFCDHKGFFTGFLILAELMKREENIERETEIVIARMTSDVQIHRKVAWDCLRLIKPELAKAFPHYDPNLPLAQCRETVRQILERMDREESPR